MQRRRTLEHEPREQSARRGVWEILGNRAVQGLLVLVAGVQVVAVQARVAGTPMRLDPVVVSAPERTDGVMAAWQTRAVERESLRLAAQYRAKGYPVSNRLARDISTAAAEYGIDPELAFGLVRAESSFRNAATSPVGAVGLTQLMPRTASWMEPGVTRRELRNPETNLRIGFKYLRYLLDRYEGDERLALLAYNRGPGTVDRALKRGRDPDNGYVDFVAGKRNHRHRLYTE